MRTTWGKPGFTSAQRGRAALSPYRPARRPMQAEPDAALPPRSAPRSEHFARLEGKVSETPRAAADRGAAAPRKTSPLPCATRTKRRLVWRKVLCPGSARQGGALPRFTRPAARCRPNQTRHCRRVVRLGANTLHGASAACPKRRVRRRTGTRPPQRKTSPLLSAARAKRRLVWRKVLRPVSPPPHAASRTLFRTKKSVRSDAHYVGKTGLRLSRAVFPSSPLPRAKKRPRSNPDRGRSACCFFQTAKVYCQTL